MKQMSIRLPDDMMAWLESEADKGKRSVNRQIEYIIDDLMQGRFTGKALECIGRHYWTNPSPATSEPCNCGAFAFGEVTR